MLRGHDARTCPWCRRNAIADVLGMLFVLGALLLFLVWILL